MTFIFIGNAVPPQNISDVIARNPQFRLVMPDNEYACACLNTLEKIGRVINISLRVKSADKHINDQNQYQFNQTIITHAIDIKSSNFIISQFERVIKYWHLLKKIIQEVDDDIVVVNLSAQLIYALPCLLAKLKYKTKYIAFTGVIYVNQDLLTALYTSLAAPLIRFADGVITFSPLFAKKSLGRIPHILYPFPIFDTTIKAYTKYRQLNYLHHNKKFTIMFSGNLSEYTGGNLLHTLIKATAGKYHWIICGVGGGSR